MKKNILFIFAAAFLLGSCKSSKDYLSRADEDRTVFDVIKKLNKKSDDEAANAALPVLYTKAQQRHLQKIEYLAGDADLNKWDRITAEYSTLQNMYEAIQNTDAAAGLVKPKNYQQEIAEVKKAAAEDYYQQGLQYYSGDNRNDLKKAYQFFKDSDKWVNGYKDAREKIDTAFNNSIVSVLINPVEDNSFFFNTGLGNMGYNYSNEYFQQNLVRDLGGKYASRYPAKFYTEWEARRDNVRPDWVVSLTLRNMDIPQPYVSSYSRNASRQIAIGTDTNGHNVYQTVRATVYVQRQSFTARGQMDVNITDMGSRKSIGYNSYSDQFDWQQEHATYTGDSRALSSNDWAMINNSQYNNMPRKEEILNELYRRIYPQVKNRISYEVDW